MSAPSHTGRGLAVEVLRTVFGLAAVLATCAAALAALDAAPAWMVGESRAVRRARSVDEAERRLGTRLILPAFFPSTLAWPPRNIRFTVRAPGAAALHIEGRDGTPRLLLVQTAGGGPGPIPDGLAPEVAVLDRSSIAVGASRGTLSRIVDDGVTCWQLAWEQDGRRLLLRSRGGVDELVRMARSARETP